MVTKAYVENIFNKSEIEYGMFFDTLYVMAVKLPNKSYFISISEDSYEDCKDDLIEQIRDYENYIERDKEHYDMLYGNEYV